MLKKHKSNEYRWTFQYIKEYNNMVAHYESKLEVHQMIIDDLKSENNYLKSCNKLMPRQKQIKDSDIEKIKQLRLEGRSYSYISNEIGWSKATISRVINGK